MISGVLSNGSLRVDGEGRSEGGSYFGRLAERFIL